MQGTKRYTEGCKRETKVTIKKEHTYSRQDTKGNTLVSVYTVLNPLESKLTALLAGFHFGILRCEDPGHEILFQDANCKFIAILFL